jgi:Ca-activated chloride channel family protein
LVVVGRYKKTGLAKVRFTGKVAAAEQKFDFPVTLVESSPDQTYAFVEKLWAMRRIGEIIDELDLKGKNEELIKELVTLSTKHGILTPYTSFLADENAAPGQLTQTDAGVRKAGDMLERLKESGGRAGFAQRAEKKDLQNAQVAAPAAAMFGGGGYGGARYRDIDKDAEVAVNAVQVVGDKVLYRRGNVWYSFDAAKRDAKDVAKNARVIERFSEEYFKLIAEASPAEKKILAGQKAGEEVMLSRPAARAEHAAGAPAPAERAAEVIHVK